MDKQVRSFHLVIGILIAGSRMEGGITSSTPLRVLNEFPVRIISSGVSSSISSGTNVPFRKRPLSKKLDSVLKKVFVLGFHRFLNGIFSITV